MNILIIHTPNSGATTLLQYIGGSYTNENGVDSTIKNDVRYVAIPPNTRSPLPIVYNGVVLLFDSTDYESLSYFKDRCIFYIQEGIPCIAFGNKDDISHGELPIGKIEKYLYSTIPVYLGSAKTGKNIDAIYNLLK